jgi:hypothetical protein
MLCVLCLVELKNMVHSVRMLVYQAEAVDALWMAEAAIGLIAQSLKKVKVDFT